ncbi:hypothetical protein [Cohnella sp. AR92]|uniref:hypothetical protein n=1 Tax=Cohnella sp. AR92 TaxID=648716 RepID=UPI000F8EC741|nr:hypothetical protein [Cohnella sp. AR92]RUS48002.1 hypothetical protein ELR57_05560 [Cohnella sp. AR92]
MNELAIENKDEQDKKAPSKAAESPAKENIVIWESKTRTNPFSRQGESTFTVIPLGEQDGAEAPLLRVYTSGFGQAAPVRSKLGNGPTAALRCAA